jgi:AcrR family transcriptional regulator
MIEAGPGRRHAQKASTRAALRQAGRRLFAAHAVEAITIDAVVAAAGVSKGSFYNHFAGREDLAEAIVGDIRAQLHNVVAATNAYERDPARRLARAVCVFLRYALEDAEGAAVLARVHGASLSVEAPHNAPLVADIADGISAGRFRIATVEAGAMLVIGVVQVGLFRLLAEPVPALAVAIAQQLTMMLLRGLGVESAEAERLAAGAAHEILRGGRA